MTEESEEKIFAFDSDKAAQRVSHMWAALGEKIVGAIEHMDHTADITDVMRWACCAEACFWKATGEADTHDVKEVLAFASADRGDHG